MTSLTGHLHFLVFPCTVWFCFFVFFLQEATLNMDFGNETDTWVSKSLHLLSVYCLRINQIGKPLISKILLICCNPTSQTWLTKGSHFSTELLYTQPFSEVLFQNEKLTSKSWVEPDDVAHREQQQCFSSQKGQRRCFSNTAIKLPKNWSYDPSLPCCWSDRPNWATADRQRGGKELPFILSSENQHKFQNLILISKHHWGLCLRYVCGNVS